MKESKYVLFFNTESEYVGYSWLSDKYFSFPLSQKEVVKNILEHPDVLLTNLDLKIYRVLYDNRAIVPDSFDEFTYLLSLREKNIYRNDVLQLTILPTMNCNCQCPYCYEVHDNLNISNDTIDEIKELINRRLDNLNYIDISWFGGEPLLGLDVIDDIGSFVGNLSKEKDIVYSSSITSNTTLLDTNACLILQNAGVHQLHVTIEGAKKRHNQVRNFKGGKPTFDLIVQNIINYLEYDSNNIVVMRVHIHSLDTAEIRGVEKMLAGFKKYTDRIRVYFRQIFTSCTDKWSLDSSSTDTEMVQSKGWLECVESLLMISHKLGFKTPSFLTERKLGYCDAEKNYSWIIRPDGFITKCSVGIERERAQATLHNGGIINNWSRLSAWRNKAFDHGLECSDCKAFPFCWGLCLYHVYQNPSAEQLKKICRSFRQSLLNEAMIAHKLSYISRNEVGISEG